MEGVNGIFGSRMLDLDLTMPPHHHHQVPTFVGRADGRKKQPSVASPTWQRIRWTDSMVRLLIMVVYCIGDDGTTEDSAAATGKGKKQGPTSAAAAALPPQKKGKGKWKSVSNAMMEKGLYVSPQQCEDKFNDLNKRYKRVIDLVGRGTACRVVENPSLLDAMDHLSRKAKEEARKLLSSKHLFFPEMCAYHNGAGCTAANESTPHPHRPDNSEDSIDDDDDEGHHIRKHKKNKHCGDDEDDKEVPSSSTSASPSPSLSLSEKATSMQRSVCGLLESLGTVGGKEEEQRHWLRRKVAELEERSLGYEIRALGIERQRYKWLRFSSNKEREMERTKLCNERVRLENDRMLLLLRQKQHELVNVNGTAS